MFTATLSDPTTFAQTFRWAILSILPTEDDAAAGVPMLRATDINSELGLAPNARTATVQVLKAMAEEGLIRRIEFRKTGQRRAEIIYCRLLPLRKRERIARWFLVN